jgi:superfamily II DNA/RNA helicase
LTVRPYCSAKLTADSELPEWSEIKLHNALKKALVALEFQKPTDIQTRSLPFALDGRDIVGVAETVSHFLSLVTCVDDVGIW